MTPTHPGARAVWLALLFFVHAGKPLAGALPGMGESALLRPVHGLSQDPPSVGPGDAGEGQDGPAGRPPDLLVLAAASLMDVLPQVADLWRSRGGAPVRFSFDATSRLGPQVAEGIQAGLFFSADERWMDWVEDRGGTVPGTRIDLLANEMVIVTPPGGGGTRVDSPQHLADPQVRHIALAGENVPAGRYAQAALENAGVWDAVADKVVRAGNVRGALEWVALGEAEAGVVYRTDAVAEDRVITVFEFDPDTHPPIRYPAAVLARAPDPELARAFLDFCRSSGARGVFQAAGFGILGTGSGDEGSGTAGDTGQNPLTGNRTGAAGFAADGGPGVSPNPWSAIRLSFLVALAATLLGFVPALWLGWILARKDFYGKSFLSTVALIPLVLPPVVTGFILLTLLGTQSPVGAALEKLGLPIPFTLLGATVAALAVGFPLYVISVRNAFQTVDASYEAVAWSLGARPGHAFFRVTFPLALPGIVAGAILAFARALGEFGATVVLAGNVEGSTRTIALAVYTLLESPEGRESIWILVGASALLSLLALLGFEALSRHQRRQMGLKNGR